MKLADGVYMGCGVLARGQRVRAEGAPFEPGTGIAYGVVHW